MFFRRRSEQIRFFGRSVFFTSPARDSRRARGVPFVPRPVWPMAAPAASGRPRVSARTVGGLVAAGRLCQADSDVLPTLPAAARPPAVPGARSGDLRRLLRHQAPGRDPLPARLPLPRRRAGSPAGVCASAAGAGPGVPDGDARRAHRPRPTCSLRHPDVRRRAAGRSSGEAPGRRRGRRRRRRWRRPTRPPTAASSTSTGRSRWWPSGSSPT